MHKNKFDMSGAVTGVKVSEIDSVFEIFHVRILTSTVAKVDPRIGFCDAIVFVRASSTGALDKTENKYPQWNSPLESLAPNKRNQPPLRRFPPSPQKKSIVKPNLCVPSSPKFRVVAFHGIWGMKGLEWEAFRFCLR